VNAAKPKRYLKEVRGNEFWVGGGGGGEGGGVGGGGGGGGV